MGFGDLVDNVKVFGLKDSITASKYPMSTDVCSCTPDITDTVKRLGCSALGSGHDNWLNGCIVQFDLTFSIKAWTEAQRYHFLDFVSSQSTMHRCTKLDPRLQCNEYVSQVVIDNLRMLISRYNENPSKESYLKILYNIPTGFKLTARMTTNYRQLKTIYHQRKNHRLPEWRMFCEWIETLPLFKELCLGE